MDSMIQASQSIKYWLWLSYDTSSTGISTFSDSSYLHGHHSAQIFLFPKISIYLSFPSSNHLFSSVSFFLNSSGSSLLNLNFPSRSISQLIFQSLPRHPRTRSRSCLRARISRRRASGPGWRLPAAETRAALLCTARSLDHDVLELLLAACAFLLHHSSPFQFICIMLRASLPSAMSFSVLRQP